ncbi:unnamed protein product [Staurois parvus]|uniref:Uncharacterized protein n=1 Tax=Staurois parvus TaxID=386267 RepID=A0ABN9AMT1_9NEOB|nr:unnamed protein product [Staurois parvus]
MSSPLPACACSLGAHCTAIRCPLCPPGPFRNVLPASLPDTAEHQSLYRTSV